jgi:hypothetical protein
MLKMVTGLVLGLEKILNVPRRVRLRSFLACGLAG